MKNQDSETAAQPEALREELRTLIADAEKLVADNVAAPTAEAVTALRDRYEAARDRAAEMYERTKERVAAGVRRTDETVRARPYEAAAVAAGVGLLVGLLVARHRD